MGPKVARQPEKRRQILKGQNFKKKVCCQRKFWLHCASGVNVSHSETLFSIREWQAYRHLGLRTREELSSGEDVYPLTRPLSAI